jgi:hypothetical protein
VTFTISPLSNVMQVAGPVACRSRLMVCIVFAYRPHRLRYLLEMLRIFSEMPVERVNVLIYTNTTDPAQLADIERLLDFVRLADKQFEIISVLNLEHGFDLTWADKSSIPERFLGSDFTHWLHLEDDCRFTYLNLCYFIYAREILRPHGLIPSFVRYEWNDSQLGFFSSDQARQTGIDSQPHIDADDVFFMVLDSVYCGSVVLDQELAAEFVETRSFDRLRSADVSHWYIQERAAMGLTWEHVPPGHICRMMVPFTKAGRVPATPCLLHHLPNNYTDTWFAGTNHPNVPFGRLRLDKIFSVNGDPGFDPARNSRA